MTFPIKCCSTVIPSMSLFPRKENGIIPLGYLTRKYRKQNLKYAFPCFHVVTIFFVHFVSWAYIDYYMYYMVWEEGRLSHESASSH